MVSGLWSFSMINEPIDKLMALSRVEGQLSATNEYKRHNKDQYIMNKFLINHTTQTGNLRTCIAVFNPKKHVYSN
jgi:hypothetical protein